MKKRRTREHVIADLAVNHVERFVLRCGYTMHRVIHDYGLDATIMTYSKGGEIENGVIWMQVKATGHLRRVKDLAAVTARVQRRDLLYWAGEVHPVILVIYDAAGDQAFWLHVQDELRGGRVFEMARSGATLTLRIPLEHTVTEGAIREFRRLKARTLAQS